jgi:hypothetical protein
VCHLVDERFFRYAADRFIAAHPPATPCLGEYGASFPAFLATFGPCAHLAYLPDLARLEWAVARALAADDREPIDIRALGGLAPAALERLRLTFKASVALLASPWPIDRLWRASQPDADPEGVVTLEGGAVCLAVARAATTVVVRALDPGAYALRAALHDGRTLGDATAAALLADSALDLTTALRDLFADGIIVGFTATTAHTEETA